MIRFSKDLIPHILVTIITINLSQSAHSQALIYDSGTILPTVGGVDITGHATANNFAFGSTQTFNTARVWLLDQTVGHSSIDSFSGTLSWFVYNDSLITLGKPGTVIASGTVSGTNLTQTNTGLDYVSGVGASRIFQMDFPISNTTLTAGTYWFSVKENSINAPSDGSLVAWLSSGSITGTTKFDTNPINPSTWNITGPYNRAFQLFNSTAAPEPSTLALITMGGIGFVSRLRSRRK
jgi:hypothetical protein